MNKNQGFSLIEMAVVLVILGLIISTLLTPLGVQRDLKDINGTQLNLKLINEAIYGFVVLNGRLPCPTTQANPANANYGLEDCSITTEGYLPWRTLGVTATDEWGTLRQATTDPWNGYWRYRRDQNYSTVALFSTNISAAVPAYAPSDALSVVNSAGIQLTSNTERPIAIIYSTGKDLLANGQNSGVVNSVYESNESTSTFDDMVIWISRPVLVNRLVTAGKLP